MYFVENLIFLKEQTGLSSYKIGDMSGIPRSTIKFLLEKRSFNPTIDTVVKIAKAFNLSLDEIVLTDLSKKEA